MRGRPIYFGNPERPRFGMVHAPDQATGGVVLCPPLGYEAVGVHPAYRELAEDLSEHGYLVLRLEYDGTGNSIGHETDPDRVPSWIASIDDAVEHLRSLGLTSTTLVGVRAGALLAAQVAAARDDVDRLVLWDPVLSGRRYTRALKMLAAGDTGARDGDDVLAGGVRFTGEALAALSRTQMPVLPAAARVLVIEPAEGAGEPWTGSDPHVTLMTLPGTAALLDTDAELARIPHELLAAVRSWLVTDPVTTEPVDLSGYQQTATAREERYGLTLQHHGTRLGANGLFATLTHPGDALTDHAVLMLNNGAAPQIGPGRAWVEWGAELASAGWSVMRLDFAGVGDSPGVPGDRSRHHVYPLGAGADIRQAVAHLRDSGVRQVVLMGLCSGALLSFDGLLATPDVDAVVCINPRFDMPWHDPWHGRRRVRAAGATVNWLAFALHKGKLFGLFDRVPGFVWWLLDVLHLHAAPTRALEAVSSHRARILLLFGSEEWGLKALRRRSGRRFRRILAGDQVTMATVADMDHSMFGLGYRDQAFTVVRGYLEETLGTPSRVTSAGPSATDRAATDARRA